MKMNKIILAVLLGASLVGGSAAVRADDHQLHSGRYSFGWWGSQRSLDAEINHLNRMVGHVRWEMQRYKGNKAMWREFTDIRSDIDRVNRKFREKNYDKRELRNRVENLHNRLHSLETRLTKR